MVQTKEPIQREVEVQGKGEKVTRWKDCKLFYTIKI